MAATDNDLRSLTIAELVEAYKKLVEDWVKRRDSMKLLPPASASPPYLDEIMRRGEGNNPLLLQLLEHPNLTVCVQVAVNFLRARIEPRLARAVLWEIAPLHETAGIDASFYLAAHDREYRIKHNVPEGFLAWDEPIPEGADSAQLGKEQPDRKN